MKTLMTNKHDIRQFIEAGTAYMLLRSKVSGREYTFLIAKPGNRWKTCPGNKAFSRNVYPVKSGTKMRRGRIGIIHNNDKSVIVDKGSDYVVHIFGWFLRHLYSEENDLPDTLEVYHLGMCGRCGRPLTDSESVRIGIGPICLTLLDPVNRGSVV